MDNFWGAVSVPGKRQVLFDKFNVDADTYRPQLRAMLAYVREGDTVIVHSMDRLARNLDDLRRLVKSLTAKRPCRRPDP